MSPDPITLPSPPPDLAFDQVTLHFSHLIPKNDQWGFVPAYHFRILIPSGIDAGHINFRVGDSDHVQLCAGHVGYEIQEPHRGHGYALQACRALAPFVKSVRRSVVITCDPDNPASLRTIEKLGAVFINEILVPLDDPHYHRGSRFKRRYEWIP